MFLTLEKGDVQRTSSQLLQEVIRLEGKTVERRLWRHDISLCLLHYSQVLAI